MSGDVQPRKRKDKKRKKDELSLEETRGTAAAFGDGDVLMHSQHEHGTGGHWCAKVIFFSLLAVLITLIGLIILENRGLSDLEASTVESRYSGVLEGWLEDAPDDNHHDEHTLELNHPDDHDGDEEDSNEEDDKLVDHNELEDNAIERDNSDYEADKEENILDSREYNDGEQEDDEDDNDDDIEDKYDDEDDENYDGSEENYNDEYDDIYDQDDNESYMETNEEDVNSIEDDTHQDEDDNEDQDTQFANYQIDEDVDEDHHDEDDGPDESDVEVEHIEHEAVDDEVISTELPALPEEEDDQESEEDKDNNDDSVEDEGNTDEDFLDNDEIDDEEEIPIVEHVTAPSGKPYREMEDSTEELPVDTLAEEDEYEKQQEDLRREEAEASHLWLKLGVGVALLVATHAVVRRATRHDTTESEEDITVEEIPTVVDRRMTLLSQEDQPYTAENLSSYESVQKDNSVEIMKKSPILIKTTRPTLDEDEEMSIPAIAEKLESKPVTVEHESPDRELYSDEDEIAEEEIIESKKYVQQTSTPEKPTKNEPDPESEDILDDVEIIDEEQIEEELEEEEDEEEISDVDDAELLTRLEAKYGRLPEPERPGQKYTKKDGGNSADDFWAEEPSDPYWRQQLDQAEQDLHQGAWRAAILRLGSAELRHSARARWLTARALDAEAEQRRDNGLLARAIAAYLHLLDMNDRLSDKQLRDVATRTLDRMSFQGNHLGTEPVHRILIHRFPREPGYRNNLTISFLMVNKAELATEILKETLNIWPDDRVALVHYGFVLKTHYNRLEEAVVMLRRGLEGDSGPAAEPRFYYHLGDALLLLGRLDEADEVHKRGTQLGFFLSPTQRSLYNVNRLKSKPWWNIEETPYKRLGLALQKSWKDILKEGEKARALYEQEKEGLRQKGEWSQLDLFVRGQEVPGRCKNASTTCSIVRAEAAAVGCRRGQIKFSSISPGTHIRPHVGPTNCRLRIHLGLSNTEGTYIRVGKEIRQWQVGKVIIFDDSFEHEVWHNGTDARLVLIVDVWHPDLTQQERRQLPAI